MNRSPLVQRNEYIGFTCVDHFDVRIVFVDQFAETEGYGQIDVLLFIGPAHGSGIFSPMSRINCNGIYTDFGILSVTITQRSEE